jgi:predicted DsbA family dithiol-disulfide isomerase
MLRVYDDMNSNTFIGIAGAFAIGALGMWILDERPTTSASPDPAGSAASASKPIVGSAISHAINPGAVKLELFAMSQCPYGVQAEALLQEVAEKFGPDLEYTIDYIGNTAPNGELTSMHGPNEVKGNIDQLCAHKYSERWVEFVACQNEKWRQIETTTDACATKVGLDSAVLKSCAEGAEGKELLAASYKRAEARDASGSPTIYVGGKEYSGARRATDVMRAVCAAYTGENPAICSDIPVPPKVDVLILTDKRCGEDCATLPIERQIPNLIANPSIKVLDYGDAEGKKLFDAIKPASLPAIAFDATLAGDKEASERLAKSLRNLGQYKVAEAGEWNPVCADKDGCSLDECKSTLFCKPEEPNKLEVFVMSECPFGVKGLDAMKEVLANFDKAGAKLTFQVHFIGEGDASSLSSMHGQSEVDEDIREACAVEHFGKDRKFMNYVWCRNKNIKDKNWEACATPATGVDAAVMKECFEGEEGKKLLAKSFAYSNSLKFGASPTWLVNGKYQFSGIDPETIKQNVCAHNKLAGCENKLSGDAPSAPGGQDAPGCGE